MKPLSPSGSVPTGEGFPKSRRLRTRPEFVRVQRRGRRVELRYLIAAWLPGTGADARFGLTVSRKVGNAVVRNRVKRRLREALRLSGPDGVRPLAALSGVDVVFIARSSAATAPPALLAANVVEAVRKIRAAVA